MSSTFELSVLAEASASFYSFKELEHDYPELSVFDWKKLASDVNVPIVKIRINVPGRRVGRLVQGLQSDDIDVIEETYSSLRDEELNLAEIAEQELMEIEAHEEAPIEEDIQIHKADETIISADLLARSLKVRTVNLLRTAQEIGVELKIYNFGPGPNTFGFRDDQADQLRVFEKERSKKFATEDIYSMATLRTELGTGPKKTFALLEELEIVPGTYLFGERRSEGLGITKPEFEKLKALVEQRKIPEAPEDVNAVCRVAPELKMSPKTLAKLANGVGILPGRYLFNGVAGYGYSDSQLNEIKQAYEPFSLSR